MVRLRASNQKHERYFSTWSPLFSFLPPLLTLHNPAPEPYTGFSSRDRSLSPQQPASFRLSVSQCRRRFSPLFAHLYPWTRSHPHRQHLINFYFRARLDEGKREVEESKRQTERKRKRWRRKRKRWKWGLDGKKEDETIRAGRSVCSVKLSLRGSSPANLWDTYNASQEYCSSCRPFYPFPPTFPSSSRVSYPRLVSFPLSLSVSLSSFLVVQSVAFERTAPSSDIEMYLTKKKRISTWHGQPFCRRSSPSQPRLTCRVPNCLPPVLIMLRNVWRLAVQIERRWKCKRLPSFDFNTILQRVPAAPYVNFKSAASPMRL